MAATDLALTFRPMREDDLPLLHNWQGLGTRMVAAFACRLLEDPCVTRVQTDPDPSNTRAVRCYEKAAFSSVGTVTTPDGPALLMVIERPLGPSLK